MVDKLDVRVSNLVPFSSDFGYIQKETRGDRRIWKQSQHYHNVADLRPFGYEAKLHMDLRHKTKGGHPHKLELIDTGQSNYTGWREEICRVFNFGSNRDIDALEVIRLDVNADVENVPPSWFHEHMRVKYKRRGAHIYEYMGITNREGETHYWGQRPNCFRVYNKIAELKVQHKRLARRASRDAELLTFEQAFQIPMCSVLTRVERQIGGGRIPAQFGTIGKLKELPEFDPFANVKILAGIEAQPNENDYAPSTYWAGMWLRKMVHENGLQRTEEIMRMRFGSNYARNRERYADFLAVSSEGCTGISKDRLTEIYKDSVTQQLAA